MKLILNLPLLALVGCATLAGTADPVWVQREVYLMGTLLEARAAAPTREQATTCLERALGEVGRLEGVLSSWSPDSEVGRLNAAAAGEAVEVSAELAALLGEAWRWSEATGGAFDPVVGALVDAWDLRGAGRHPSPEELRAAADASGIRLYRREAGRVTRLSDAAWLDTGGFGKGAALRSAVATLRGCGSGAGSLNFGGQVATYGEPPEGGAWRVAVAHPGRRDQAALWLTLDGGSVSTTAQSERGVEVDGAWYGHVLDPRSGMPVAPWGSVTVAAEDAVVADAVSTALFVMGPERARAWAAAHPEVGVLLLQEREGGVEASWNDRMSRYIETRSTTTIKNRW